MNLVEITVTATAAQAKAALDEIKVKLDDLGSRVHDARIRLAGNAEAQLQLAKVNARLMELSRIIADPKISIEGVAKAQAELLALLATMKRLEDQSGTTGNWLSRLNNRFTSMGNSSHLLSRLIGNLGSTFTSSGGMMAGSLPILVAVAAALLAMIGVVGTLISELAAAGLAVGAFAAFAIPTFMKIFAGIQAVSAATTATARNAAWDAIPKAMRPSVQAGLDLKNTFDKLSASIKPQVFKIFSEALKGISNILPQLLPLARVAGDAIGGLLKHFDKFSKSQGFSSFLAQMQTIAGPAITAIGKGLGQLAGSLGKFLQVAASPQGIIVLQGAFSLLSGVINTVTWLIKLSQSQLVILANIGSQVAREVVGSFKWITDAVLTMAGTLARVAASIPGPWQKSMQHIANSIASTKANADVKFAQWQAGINAFARNVNNLTPIFHLQANITDLQNKLTTARGLLSDPNLTKTRRAAIQANITDLIRKVAQAKAMLDALNGKTVQTYVATYLYTVGQTGGPGGGHPLGSAHGGIIGAATGGLHGGLRMVGEHGRELVRLPAGSYVHSNPDTERMIAGGGGGSRSSVVLELHGGSSDFDRFMANWILKYVRIQGGGDVQVAFGRIA